MQKVKIKNHKTQAGFTLFELALVMMISGLTMLMLAELVRVYTINGEYEMTLENTDMSQTALREFFVVQKRYPCPADPTLVPGDANYGLERCRTDANITANPDNCAATPLNISCTTNFSRDGDQNGQPDVVMIGIIPFRTLYNEVIDTPFVEAHRKDGYGVYLSYAVTEHMTYSWHNLENPANPHTGAIRVEDENGISVVIPDDSAHYTLFSHGENSRGGYTQAGIIIDDCLIPAIIMGDPDVAAPPGPSAAGIIVEKENCDNNDAIFVQGIRSLADNSNYNDDLLIFNRPQNNPLWTRSLSAQVPIGESWIYNTNRGFVGIGLTDPAERLHINDNLSAEVTTSGVEYCGNGADSTTCVIPARIAGTIASGGGSTCPNANEAAYAIQDNQVVCRQVGWTMPAANCPAGEYLTGFSNLGNIDCSPPP
ncbi:MAG: hypothetical protein COA45_05615 [Zetaproteobacteria bacterium]|nr:MAG: hypothetical protein COA45_05615 [Zetaproteobacteria bacterium]